MGSEWVRISKDFGSLSGSHVVRIDAALSFKSYFGPERYPRGYLRFTTLSVLVWRIRSYIDMRLNKGHPEAPSQTQPQHTAVRGFQLVGPKPPKHALPSTSATRSFVMCFYLLRAQLPIKLQGNWDHRYTLRANVRDGRFKLTKSCDDQMGFCCSGLFEDT